MRTLTSVFIFFLLFTASMTIAQPNHTDLVTHGSEHGNLSSKIRLIDDDLFVIDDMIFSRKSVLQKGFSGPKWTDGRVYYRFAPYISQKNRQRFVDAANEWANVAALTFIEISTEQDQPNYIYVNSEYENSARVGMSGGMQHLSVVNWESRFIIAHELGHALGFFHEQSRPDRDTYVEIVWDNITAGREQNFEIRDTQSIGPYDFASIMHYRATSFSSNGEPTIRAKPDYEAGNQLMGNRAYLSNGDRADMAYRYGPKIVPIPDEPFKGLIIGQFDLNQDGQLDTYEATQIRELRTPGQNEIQSLEGVQAMTGLVTLVCAFENLTHLPPMPRSLKVLDLSGNPLEFNDCSQLAKLMVKHINVTFNPIAGGADLDCFGQELIGDDHFADPFFSYLKTQFDLNHDGHLNQVEAQAVDQLDTPGTIDDPGNLTSLKGLDQFPNLRILRATGEALSQLPDLTNLTLLEELYVDNNQLTSMPDLSHLTRLKRLDCHGNQLQKLTGFENLPDLEYLRIRDNQLSEITNLPPTLYYLSAGNNRLKAFPGIESLVDLRFFWCYNNLLTVIPNTGRAQTLSRFDCYGNDFDFRSCGLLSDLLYRDMDFLYNPQANGKDLTCSERLFFSGINARAGNYTVNLVNGSSDFAQTASVGLRYLDEGGFLISEETVEIAPRGALKIALTDTEIKSLTIDSDGELAGVLTFADEAQRQYAIQGGRFLLEDSFTPHIARDVDSFATLIHTTAFADDASSFLLETQAVEPGLTPPEAHFLMRELNPESALVLDLSLEMGRAVVKNSSLAQVSANGHHSFLSFESLNGKGIAALPLQRNGWVSEEIFFPHVAVAPGWWTGVGVVNPGDRTNRVILAAYNTDNQAQWVRVVDISARSNWVQTPENIFTTFTSGEITWIQARGESPISGIVLFGRHDTGAFAGTQAATSVQLARKLVFPAIEVSATTWTGIALLNRHGSEVSVKLTGYGWDGTMLSAAQATLPRKHRRAKPAFGPQGWISLDEDQIPMLAYLVAEADQPIAGLAVNSTVTTEGLGAYQAHVVLE